MHVTSACSTVCDPNLNRILTIALNKPSRHNVQGRLYNYRKNLEQIWDIVYTTMYGGIPLLNKTEHVVHSYAAGKTAGQNLRSEKILGIWSIHLVIPNECYTLIN